MESIAHSYMEEEGVWIIPKQNKIRVGCKLVGELAHRLKANEVAFAQVDNEWHQVNRFLFAIDAKRVMGGRVSSERAPLFALNSEQQMIAPDMISISPMSSVNVNSDIEVVWHKLQFTSPTAGNSDKSSPREKFHFVISFMAEINQNGQTASYPVAAIVSPALIVIGQNPARFKRSRLKQQKNHTLQPSSSPQPPSLALLSPQPSSPIPLSVPNPKKRRSDSPFQYIPPTSDFCISNMYNSTTPQNFVPVESFPQNTTPVFSPYPLSSHHPIPTQPGYLTSPPVLLPSQTNPYLAPSPPQTSTSSPVQDPSSFPSSLPSSTPSSSPISPSDLPSSFCPSTMPPSSAFPSTSPPPFPSTSPSSFPSSPSSFLPSSPVLFENLVPEHLVPASLQENFGKVAPPWIPSSSCENHILSGKVGINYHPHEALTVGGSIFYTGDLVKPSDSRIKKNITLLHNTNRQNEHRENISAIKLYNYDRVDLGSAELKYVQERGVIAQEVQKVIPAAVVQLKNAVLPDGTVVQNLLAVNDRELLLETIGATQELSSEADSIQKEVESLATVTKEHSTLLHTLVAAIASVRRSEATGSSFLNIFGIGPAWTCCVLGFFVPVFFLVGAFYMCSPVQHRQVAGLVSIVLFTSQAVEYGIVFAARGMRGWAFVYIFFGWWCMGVIICVGILLSICWKARKAKAKQLDKS
eukprot:Phypoly_transcript_03933.p1 GENE.Phypoly_transcript_03933~~Phypoly_transcript_03933.p1  ORF type:complete len:747 (+),score=146.97 Phypoly_transcript_03933:165-2243(+)